MINYEMNWSFQVKKRAPARLKMLQLKRNRELKKTHVFIAGNHDFAFAAFVRALPEPGDGSEFWETWKEYKESEERERWYKGDGYEKMHLQWRRWAGKITVRFNTVKNTEYKGSIYDAAPTFESYGVPHGSAGRTVTVGGDDEQ